MSPTNVETKFQNLLHSYSENRENFVTHEYVDISQSIENFRQLIVLGEPGSGKTTLLWRITFDYATKAKSDPLAPIPVFIHLGELVEDKNLTWLINEQLGRLASSFSDLLAEKRIAFMLDGLNEIANEHKNNALAEIRDLIEHCVKENIVIVLTSRYREYVDSMDMGILNQISITPLNASQIYQFIRNHITNPPSAADDLFWTLAGDKARSHWEKLSKNVTLDFTAFWTSGSLPKGTVDEQTKQWWNEWITVRDTPQGWLPLAVNPFMLYMIIQVYSRAGKLPQNRGALFEVFSDFLLVEREKNAPDESREIKRKLADLAHAMMLINGTSVSQNEALKYLKDEGSLNRALDANLLSGNTEIRFSHQLFQEYFAARRIDSEMNIGTPAHQFFAPENWWEPSGWEETIMLLAGVYNDDCTPVLEWLHDAQPELTARCVKESGANTPRSTLEMLKQQWIPRLVDISRDPDPNARTAVGRALGILQLDTRNGVGLRNGLPEIEWCEIPGGQFLLGSDSSRTSEASDNEQPQHTVHLPSYYIARYPITCVQYQAFVDSGGYQDRRYWTSVSWKWKNEEEIDGPLYLKDSFWSVTNHPVVGVSWYEACAFTRWFTESAGVEIRLPTEPEWEKAARGTDGRQYPWGDAFSEGYANVRVEKPGYSIMRSSTVGIYPQGQSPFGVYDMCGNVLEWCFNESGISYPYSESSDINSDKHRAARGGSWSTNANLARAAVRNGFLPDSRFNYLGFRVVTLSPIS